MDQLSNVIIWKSNNIESSRVQTIPRNFVQIFLSQSPKTLKIPTKAVGVWLPSRTRHAKVPQQVCATAAQLKLIEILSALLKPLEPPMPH